MSRNFLTPNFNNKIEKLNILELEDASQEQSSSHTSEIDSSDNDSIFGGSKTELVLASFVRPSLKRSASSVY